MQAFKSLRQRSIADMVVDAASPVGPGCCQASECGDHLGTKLSNHKGERAIEQMSLRTWRNDEWMNG